MFFRQFDFHKMKLAYHRASMKSHEAYLQKMKLVVKYIDANQDQSDVRVLLDELAQDGIEVINYINPTDCWLEKRLKDVAQQKQVELVEHETHMFLNSDHDLASFFKASKKTFFQTTFYKQQRIQRNILVNEDNQPLGGQWSFDVDNRKRYPKKKVPPPIQSPAIDMHWEEAVRYVEKHFAANLGHTSEQPAYPYNRMEADKWLQQFFEHRFKEFGLYEDAIVQNEIVLNHSLLTPMMNVGILGPQEVLNRALAYAEQHDIPINSLEGFVRQILGWREFIRGLYEHRGGQMRTRNFWGFRRKIPKSFYEGTTGIEPIDNVIRKVLRNAYCHHIERLMVLGNFMLLCEFDPDDVYRWFMELFIDSYDWVMVPNVYGMSQFADGGLMATKPYISSSNYLMKMGDYQKGKWQSIWDGLFWRFMHTHREFFLQNPRLGMLIRTFDKMDRKKQRAHLEQADNYLKELDKLTRE